MPRYRVTLSQRVWQTAYDFIDADSEDDAREKVYDALLYGDLNLDWQFGDIDDDAEIDLVEEVE